MNQPIEVSVIVPAFREAENLPLLAPRIAQALDDARKTYEIVIVDDNSRDGTLEVCAELAKTLPLRLITRTAERGLATAVIRGLEEAQGKVLVVMDADLSHPPEAISALVDRCLEPTVDFVFGSRYVAGGAVDESWSLWRRINSRTATMLARGLTSASDPMAGFFSLRRETFQQAHDLQPLGYKIGLELIIRCGCNQIAEIPIHFQDRTCGDSKLDAAQQWLYLRHLARLYQCKFPTTNRVIRFGLVGLTGMVVDLTALATLMTSLPFALARVLSIVVAMTWNFALHRNFTFPQAKATSAWRQYLKFCGACSLGAAVNWSVSMIVAGVAGSSAGASLAASAVGVLAGAFTNFWLADRAVFSQVETPKSAAMESLPQIVQFEASVESATEHSVPPQKRSA